MPQFNPGDSKTAKATFSNPKSAGFDYSASLCMGTGWTEMARTSFHLDAGQSKVVDFPVTMPATPGTYPVYFKVSCGGVLIGTFSATENVVIVPPVTISYTGNATRWAARLYDTLTGKWQSCGARAVSQSCSFIVSGGPGLLEITRSTQEGGDGPWYSTTIINLLPKIDGGNYTWDDVRRSLDGVALYAGKSIPYSQITGTVTKVEQITNWTGALEVWYTFAIDWVSGATNNIGQYFVGGSVRGRAAYQAPSSILKQGSKYSAKLYVRENMGGTIASPGSVSWCFVYDECREPSPYPPEYYAFTGSLTYLPTYPTYSVDVKISGTAPRFAIVIIEMSGWWEPIQRQWRLTGPFSDKITVDSGPHVFMMFAHPDVNMPFDPDKWRLQNWISVAAISTEG